MHLGEIETLTGMFPACSRIWSRSRGAVGRVQRGIEGGSGDAEVSRHESAVLARSEVPRRSAACSPACVRSTIKLRSISVSAPIMCMTKRPLALVVSIESDRLRKLNPRSPSSAMRVTRWKSDLPNRSSFQTMNRSGLARAVQGRSSQLLWLMNLSYNSKAQ